MSSGPDWIRVARVLGAHGTAGELSCELLGGDRSRLPPGLVLRVAERQLRLAAVRGEGERLICSLEGVADRGAASQLAGAYLEVAAEQARLLPEGEFFHFQLVGLQVRDRQGRHRGAVVDVEVYPAHDVYVVRGAAGEQRVPAVRQAVMEIDAAEGWMTVDDGYLEEWVDAV
ncbi:MAG: ribosome maturation factor RimM [Candidatus Dormibacteria bacterium]